MKLTKKITVLMVDDNVSVRESFSDLLAAEGRTEVVGQAANGREAVKMAMRLRPDVILMDLAMPVLNGFDATQQILAADSTAKVLVLSAHNDPEYVLRATVIGAVGYLVKQSAAKILTKAICEVAEGKLFFSPAIIKRMADRRS